MKHRFFNTLNTGGEALRLLFGLSLQVVYSPGGVVMALAIAVRTTWIWGVLLSGAWLLVRCLVWAAGPHFEGQPSYFH